MTTTATKKKARALFSPSVNIIRDADAQLQYIPTSNTKQAFTQIINDYKTGTRSFSIVGAYGTGKSSFLWAFEKNINKKHAYFADLNDSFGTSKGFEFFSLVGEYQSIVDSVAKRLGLKTGIGTEEVMQQLDKYYKSLHKVGKGLVILVDEFGKFLEYAAKHNPENELYFIQLLAEYANDPSREVFFITTLHQNFNGYSLRLTKSQQNEWTKVKGRLQEITFNEPVEQLLFLASERFNELNIGIADKNFSKLFKAIDAAKAFPLKDFFHESYAEKVLPFDILSMAVLTLALQRYGQNERSLFSFIESNDQFGIRDFNQKKSPYYNIACVYDYLIHNYYSFLNTKYNPDYPKWSAIRTAVEKTEGALEENIVDALKLIKTIGLLNIFASASIRLNDEFLCDYGKYSLGIKDPGQLIDKLVKHKILRFAKHSGKYVLAEATDLDIELAIDEAGNLVEQVTNVVHPLNEHFDFPYIPAKAVFFTNGTPRFFAFHLSDLPAEDLRPQGEVDGYINLVFSTHSKDKERIIEASSSCKEAVLYGWYRNTAEIKTQLFEIEKIKKVRQNNVEDKIALRELDKILQHHTALLNHYVLSDIFSENSPVQWFFDGKKEKVNSRKSFNRLLSRICEHTYPDTPVYRNEMVNKSKISSQISTARSNLIQALVNQSNLYDLGFDPNRFPPEKTIYRSLLQETGIHRMSEGGYALLEPLDESFLPIWQAGIDFLESTKNGKRNLQEFVEILQSKPYKLKQGFIDFWLPIFLLAKQDDYALFSKEGYIPFLTPDSLELLGKNPEDYEIKAFDIAGVKLDLFNRYRLLLNLSEHQQPTGRNFIETIRPFLTFLKQLPEYAKTTKRMSKRALAIRDAITYSKSPEETFFEKFPQALGYNIEELQQKKGILEKYVGDLQDCIREIRTCYEELVERVEAYLLKRIIGETLTYPDYQKALQQRFKKLKKHLLLPYQRVFYQRVMSELDDRKSWLSSLTQGCVGKSLETISDEDEVMLYEKLKDLVHELDNLCELSKADIDEEKELVFKLELTSFVEGLKKNLIRLPKSKNTELIQLHSIIKAKLTNDKQLNIATLTKLLEELLKNEKAH